MFVWRIHLAKLYEYVSSINQSSKFLNPIADNDTYEIDGNPYSCKRVLVPNKCTISYCRNIISNILILSNELVDSIFYCINYSKNGTSI